VLERKAALIETELEHGSASFQQRKHGERLADIFSVLGAEFFQLELDIFDIACAIGREDVLEWGYVYWSISCCLTWLAGLLYRMPIPFT
jgi:hypothetical protein